MTKRLQRFKKQRGGNLSSIQEWLKTLDDDADSPYGKNGQVESYVLSNLKKVNYMITASNDADFDFGEKSMNGNFTNKTFFYNVAKALNNILREILMQENITPQAFLNHIKLLQQPGDNSTIGLQNSLLFMTEVENTLRNILDVNHTYDPEILINEKAYPLYIWAMAINVDDSDEQLRPILLSNTSESGPIEPAPPELQAP